MSIGVGAMSQSASSSCKTVKRLSCRAGEMVSRAGEPTVRRPSFEACDEPLRASPRDRHCGLPHLSRFLALRLGGVATSSGGSRRLTGRPMSAELGLWPAKATGEATAMEPTGITVWDWLEDLAG